MVACLSPDPGTTRGEVRAFVEYAEQQGWRSVTVVTHRTHANRTRMLFERCFDGQVHVHVVDMESTRLKFRSYFYEVGAFGKAMVLQDC